jgi:PEP-CTERM motif
MKTRKIITTVAFAAVMIVLMQVQTVQADQISGPIEQVAVPEPATVSCLLLGLGALVSARRFRKK